MNWDPTQTLSTTGSFTIGGGSPIAGTIKTHDDSPDFGINQGTTGRLDWLDLPGFPSTQGGGKLTAANLTDTFTSTVTDKSGASCSVNWSVHFTLQGGKWSFTFTP
jgi:hypothetical protein